MSNHTEGMDKKSFLTLIAYMAESATDSVIIKHFEDAILRYRKEEAGRAEKHYWADLWRFRELFYILSWRDIKVRYKQTVVGALWSIIRPLLTMIIFTLVFSKIAKLPSEGAAPYASPIHNSQLLIPVFVP